MLFFVIFLLMDFCNGQVIVKTPNGDICGKSVTVLDGTKGEAFLGIPYAVPPLGYLRFERPQPLSPWYGTTKMAQEYSWGCPELFFPFTTEDCLTINIIRPTTPSPDPRGYPVMFFIHGGGFYQGSSFFYHYSGPLSTIIPCGIIFVSINYRLGPWGWLTTDEGRYPGNMGLWDMIEALKFHKRIIGSFGGDPERITIFGESAGGVSVSWLTLTPHTDGLFSKAISMSGSALSIWGHNERVIESSRILLSAMKCPLDGEAAVECLKTKSKSEILDALKPIMPTVVRRDDLNIVYWGPRVGGAGDILPGGSLREAILHAPKRPQMIGVNTMEMLTFAVPNIHLTSTDLGLIPIPKISTIALSYERFCCTLKTIFGNRRIFGPNAPILAQRIITFYSSFYLHYPSNPWLHIYLKCLTDVDFVIPAIREAKLKAASGWPQINMYRYSYANPFLQVLFDPRIKGAAHAMELFNIFDYSLQFLKPFPTQDANIVQHNFINIFLDFVKDRVILPRVAPNSAPFVDINLINAIHRDMDPEIVQFWDNLGNEFGFDWPSGDYTF